MKPISHYLIWTFENNLDWQETEEKWRKSIKLSITLQLRLFLWLGKVKFSRRNLP